MTAWAIHVAVTAAALSSYTYESGCSLCYIREGDTSFTEDEINACLQQAAQNCPVVLTSTFEPVEYCVQNAEGKFVSTTTLHDDVTTSFGFKISSDLSSEFKITEVAIEFSGCQAAAKCGSLFIGQSANTCDDRLQKVATNTYSCAWNENTLTLRSDDLGNGNEVVRLHLDVTPPNCDQAVPRTTSILARRNTYGLNEGIDRALTITLITAAPLLLALAS